MKFRAITMSEVHFVGCVDYNSLESSKLLEGSIRYSTGIIFWSKEGRIEKDELVWVTGRRYDHNTNAMKVALLASSKGHLNLPHY